MKYVPAIGPHAMLLLRHASLSIATVRKRRRFATRVLLYGASKKSHQPASTKNQAAGVSRFAFDLGPNPMFPRYNRQNN
jgi:hypothetical protein